MHLLSFVRMQKKNVLKVLLRMGGGGGGLSARASLSPLCINPENEPLRSHVEPHPMHYCTSQPHPYALLHTLCTITQASPTPMHYCTSPTLCTIAQASPTPMHYCTSPTLCTIAQASPTLCTIAQASPTLCTIAQASPTLCTIAQASPTLCTIAQARPIPRHCCTSQPHPYRAGGHQSFSGHFTDMADQTATYKVTMSCHINPNKFFTLHPTPHPSVQAHAGMLSSLVCAESFFHRLLAYLLADSVVGCLQLNCGLYFGGRIALYLFYLIG